jgi:hypothetical protein
MTVVDSGIVNVSALNDIVISAMFTDVKSAGLAAEFLVKDVLGECCMYCIIPIRGNSHRRR